MNNTTENQKDRADDDADEIQRLRDTFEDLAAFARNRTTTRIMLRDRIHSILLPNTKVSRGAQPTPDTQNP